MVLVDFKVKQFQVQLKQTLNTLKNVLNYSQLKSLVSNILFFFVKIKKNKKEEYFWIKIQVSKYWKPLEKLSWNQ